MSSAKSVTALRSQKTEGWSDRLIALLATIGSVGQVQTSTAVFFCHNGPFAVVALAFYPVPKPFGKRNATQPPNRLPQPAGKARA